MTIQTCVMLLNEIYDEDDDISLIEMYKQLFPIKTGRKRRRILQCYKNRQYHYRPELYSEVWIDSYVEYDFFQIFRLKRLTFQQLLQLIIHQGGILNEYTGGYEPVQPQKMQQIGLYYLAHQMSMTQIADKFDVATSTVFNCISTWIGCILKLVPMLIRWPTINERVNIEEKFQNIAGFPGVTGVIDGCHINVLAPTTQQTCYQNRYMTHSIILQGICTADYLLINVYVGHPGSTNDCRVLSNSNLNTQIEANGYTKYFLPHQHLLGDKIYPLKEWLLPPFKDYGNITRMQTTYNKIHSKTRVKIENCFGLLKGRWRRLKYIAVYKIEKASNIVMACCALHNFCLINNDIAEALLDIDIERHDGIQVARKDDEKHLAIEKRNNIMIGLSER